MKDNNPTFQYTFGGNHKKTSIAISQLSNPIVTIKHNGEEIALPIEELMKKLRK